MVRYEVALILQSLPKDKLKVAFKTAVTTILNEGALLRQIQFLGHRKLPYRMKAHNAGYHHGSYLICSVEAGPQMTEPIVESLRRIKTVIRVSMVKP